MYITFCSIFNTLMLLVWQQGGHLASKIFSFKTPWDILIRLMLSSINCEVQWEWSFSPFHEDIQDNDECRLRIEKNLLSYTGLSGK